MWFDLAYEPAAGTLCTAMTTRASATDKPAGLDMDFVADRANTDLCTWTHFACYYLVLERTEAVVLAELAR